ncbi:MAG: hypothetical protein RBU30_08945 [Polyangia bacterium]|jgi:hypothetical protein|nr:hypothetical protein [Polyangia bacterium]
MELYTPRKLSEIELQVLAVAGEAIDGEHTGPLGDIARALVAWIGKDAALVAADWAAENQRNLKRIIGHTGHSAPAEHAKQAAARALIFLAAELVASEQATPPPL